MGTAKILACFTAIATVVMLLMAFPFMWIWNRAVVEAITIARPIDYWTAFWLMTFICVFLAGTKYRDKE